MAKINIEKDTEPLHLNSVPRVIKNKLKYVARSEGRSLEKQVLIILREYIEGSNNG